MVAKRSRWEISEGIFFVSIRLLEVDSCAVVATVPRDWWPVESLKLLLRPWYFMKHRCLPPVDTTSWLCRLTWKLLKDFVYLRSAASMSLVTTDRFLLLKLTPISVSLEILCGTSYYYLSARPFFEYDLFNFRWAVVGSWYLLFTAFIGTVAVSDLSFLILMITLLSLPLVWSISKTSSGMFCEINERLNGCSFVKVDNFFCIFFNKILLENKIVL